jgi:aryl-alcohol dehydrogenase-like predicted oxidoreductase
VAHVEENRKAADLTLDAVDIKRIDEEFPIAGNALRSL